MPYKPFPQQGLDPFTVAANQAPPQNSQQDWQDRMGILQRLGLGDSVLGSVTQVGADLAMQRQETKDKLRGGILKLVGL